MLRVTGHHGAKTATLLEKGNTEAPGLYKFGTYTCPKAGYIFGHKRPGLKDILFWAQDKARYGKRKKCIDQAIGNFRQRISLGGKCGPTIIYDRPKNLGLDCGEKEVCDYFKARHSLFFVCSPGLHTAAFSLPRLATIHHVLHTGHDTPQCVQYHDAVRLAFLMHFPGAEWYAAVFRVMSYHSTLESLYQSILGNGCWRSSLS